MHLNVGQFAADPKAAQQSLPNGKRAHQLLNDVSSADIQRQEVIASLRDLATHSPKTSAFALVNSSALAGRQPVRLFAGLEPGAFRNVPEAIGWLDGPRRR